MVDPAVLISAPRAHFTHYARRAFYAGTKVWMLRKTARGAQRFLGQDRGGHSGLGRLLSLQKMALHIACIPRPGWHPKRRDIRYGPN
jgi:hypothetical protein